MRITRTLFLGAMITGGAACGATTTASKVSVVPEPESTTVAESNDAIFDEQIMDLVWDSTSTTDRESMCWGYETFDDSQFRLFVAEYAPEMDIDAFVAKLAKEC